MGTKTNYLIFDFVLKSCDNGQGDDINSHSKNDTQSCDSSNGLRNFFIFALPFVDFLCYVIYFIHNILKCLLMYSLRLFLKSFFLFFLVSCQSNLPAQENHAVKSLENEEAKEEKNIVVGAERIEEIKAILADKNVGLIANQTSLVGNTHLVDTLLACDLKVVKVFSPEHGFRGDADAGEHVSSNKDPKTGLPIISLYGGNKKPKSEQLKGIDILVFDLQDVGA